MEYNKHIPIYSLIGTGIPGEGVSAEIVTASATSFSFLLRSTSTGQVVLRSPELSIGEIYFRQTDNSSFVIGRNGEETTIQLPKASGTNIFVSDDPQAYSEGSTYIIDLNSVYIEDGATPEVNDVMLFPAYTNGRSLFMGGPVTTVLDNYKVIVYGSIVYEFPIPTISGNGTWVIQDVDTGIMAVGPQGPEGPQASAATINAGIYVIDTLPDFDETEIGQAFLVSVLEDDGSTRYDLYIRGSEAANMETPWTIIESWDGTDGVSVTNVYLEQMYTEEDIPEYIDMTIYATKEYVHTYVDTQFEELEQFLEEI